VSHSPLNPIPKFLIKYCSGEGYKLWFWTTNECNIAIICTSLAPLRALVNRVFPSLFNRLGNNHNSVRSFIDDETELSLGTFKARSQDKISYESQRLSKELQVETPQKHSFEPDIEPAVPRRELRCVQGRWGFVNRTPQMSTSSTQDAQSHEAVRGSILMV
jgi:hypothetical protein